MTLVVRCVFVLLCVVLGECDICTRACVLCVCVCVRVRVCCRARKYLKRLAPLACVGCESHLCQYIISYFALAEPSRERLPRGFEQRVCVQFCVCVLPRACVCAWYVWLCTRT